MMFPFFVVVVLSSVVSIHHFVSRIEWRSERIHSRIIILHYIQLWWVDGWELEKANQHWVTEAGVTCCLEWLLDQSIQWEDGDLLNENWFAGFGEILLRPSPLAIYVSSVVALIRMKIRKSGESEEHPVVSRRNRLGRRSAIFRRPFHMIRDDSRQSIIVHWSHQKNRSLHLDYHVFDFQNKKVISYNFQNIFDSRENGGGGKGGGDGGGGAGRIWFRSRIIAGWIFGGNDEFMESTGNEYDMKSRR